MLTLKYTAKFRRDLMRIEKRGKSRLSLPAVPGTLQAGNPLAPKHQDHALSGEWQGFRECHIENDRLLIYHVDGTPSFLPTVWRVILRQVPPRTVCPQNVEYSAEGFVMRDGGRPPFQNVICLL